MSLAPFFALTLIALPAAAADQSASCDTPAHHQMDFRLGDWARSWQGGKGTSHVTRDANNCAIVEHFDEDAADTPPLTHGVNLSSYRPDAEWQQMWVDDRNNHFSLGGGLQADGTFVLRAEPILRGHMGEPEGDIYEDPMRRAVFGDIARDSFTWRWQSSQDGRTWTDLVVVLYRRVK